MSFKKRSTRVEKNQNKKRLKVVWNYFILLIKEKVINIIMDKRFYFINCIFISIWYNTHAVVIGLFPTLASR